MEIPSRDLIECKLCGAEAPPHKAYKALCEPCAKRRNVEYQRQYRERQKATPRIVECKGCGKQFDASRNGRTWRCPDCTRAYLAAHRDRHRQWHADYSRKYRAGLGDAYRQRMVKRRADMIAEMTPDELAAFRRWETDKSKRIFAKLREDVFAAYGGARCACCGETERAFLSIDHIDNDGAEQRRNGDYGRSGTAFYQWLRKNGFPPGFQVLCMNCNVGKHRNGGVCPHQSGKV
jgi:DNA-directed RNA polymerase subunit RPC12/RpoP